MSRLHEPVIRELAEAGVIRNVQVIGHGREWHVEFEIGMERRPVLTQRGRIRRWRHLDTVTRWLREMGIAKWKMDATQYDPDHEVAA